MKSVLFQEFAPDGAPTQDLPGESVDRQLARAWAEGHATGAREGAEASAAAHAESQDVLRAELVEVLRDQQIHRREAQAAVLRGVAPAVTAVVRRLAPRLAETGLAEHLGAALDEAFGARPEPVPVIRCAAESAQGLELALAGRSGHFRVETDPRLTPLEAELHWQDGFDAIDMNGLMTAIDQALDAALTPSGDELMKEERANG